MNQVQLSSATTTSGQQLWRPDEGHDVVALAHSIAQKEGHNVYRPEVQDAIEANINSSSDKLRDLSLDIHGVCAQFISNKSDLKINCCQIDHPELKFEEKCETILHVSP